MGGGGQHELRQSVGVFGWAERAGARLTNEEEKKYRGRCVQPVVAWSSVLLLVSPHVDWSCLLLLFGYKSLQVTIIRRGVNAAHNRVLR